MKALKALKFKLIFVLIQLSEINVAGGVNTPKHLNKVGIGLKSIDNKDLIKLYLNIWS